MLIFTYHNWTLIEFETRAREIEFENTDCELDFPFLDQVLTPKLPPHITLFDRDKFSTAMKYLTAAETAEEIISWQTITAYLNLYCKKEEQQVKSKQHA